MHDAFDKQAAFENTFLYKSCDCPIKCSLKNVCPTPSGRGLPYCSSWLPANIVCWCIFGNIPTSNHSLFTFFPFGRGRNMCSLMVKGQALFSDVFYQIVAIRSQAVLLPHEGLLKKTIPVILVFTHHQGLSISKSFFVHYVGCLLETTLRLSITNKVADRVRVSGHSPSTKTCMGTGKDVCHLVN